MNLEVSEILVETTNGLHSHEYHLNKAGKLVAFKPVNGELQQFTVPMMFSKSRRKFKKK